MLEAFGYWVREFDVDGFRVDMAWAVRERAPGFWSRWRWELQRIKPDLLLLAEASARDAYFFAEGFDAAYDWTEDLGDWAWSGVFGDPARLTSRLDAALTNGGSGYHLDALIFRFLNNNDTGERFVSRYGEGVTRVAAALLLTLPGLPCLYTGDEVGAEFEPYDEGPPISWKDRYGLRDHYKGLISLRKQIPSLRSRSWMPLEVEPAGSLYGYLRYLEPAEQPVIVLLNWHAKNLEAKVEVPEQFRFLTSHATLHDVLADERVRPGDALRVPMRGHSARVIKLPED